MQWPFVSRKKHEELQRIFTSMRRSYYDAINAMDVLEIDREPRDFERARYTLAHRIRIHRAELKFQPMADETGKTWNWVCMDDDRGPRVAWDAEFTGSQEQKFHQHSIKPRTPSKP